MPYHGEVVRDEKIGEADLPLQIFHHIHDLCLHGNIERRYRFVAYYEFRHDRYRSGDPYPLPLSASRGDQILNADYFKKRGYAEVIAQEDLTPETLLSALCELEAHREELIGNMSRSAEADGTNNVLTIILKSIGVK